MKKKNMKLIVGLVVIVLLCSAYFGLKSYNQKTEEAEEEAAAGETILEVDTSALAEISFMIDGEETSFTLQDDGTWQKDDDDTFPVSGTALLSSLSELTELKSLRTLTEIEDASEYGFDEPQNLITLTDEDGNETVVTIGSNNDSTGNDYLILNEDTTTVYTVSTDLREGFSDDLYDYAESEELPSILASEVTGINVETADGENYDLYIEDSIWMVSGVSESGADDVEVTAEELAEGVEADADTADTLTSTVAGISYVGFLDHNCSDFSEYGLDEPAVTLTITYEEEVGSEEETDLSDAETETEEASGDETETETEQEVETIELSVTFYIGDTDDSGNYYVRFGDSLEVHTLSGNTISTLLGYTAYDLIAEPEEETETETEDVTEASGTETESDVAETEAETGTAETEEETGDTAEAEEETETAADESEETEEETKTAETE